DTRNGNQDVFFDRYTLDPAPQAPGDRFEANDTYQTATNLGTVLGRRVVPRLVAGAGDTDWFKVQAGAAGDLFVSASAAAGGQALGLELWSADGSQKLADGSDLTDSSGAVVGKQITRSGAAGTTYLVHVSGGSARTTYTLEARSLTSDLG